MMKHPEFDQMIALAQRLPLELHSSDRKNLVGSQIIPDKSRSQTLRDVSDNRVSRSRN
jgi:hypothetical protein